MKKIINSILAFVTLFSVTSCDLDMDPETAIRPEDAYTMEYCEGVRGYVYVDLKALLSGGFYSTPDLYVDVRNDNEHEHEKSTKKSEGQQKEKSRK